MTTRRERRQQAIDRAAAADTSDARNVLALAEELQGVDEFGRARRMLQQARASKEVLADAKLDLKFRQQIALSTYKDTHLNDEQRLLEALDVLDAGDHLAKSDDPETLGLAGAIHKRLWEVRNDKRELERSLAYYRRGHAADRAQGFQPRQGYPGINAAFVLDLLADIETALDPGAEADPQTRRDAAATIRREIAEGLEPRFAAVEDKPGKDDFWALVTLAEARFGLGEFKEARRWLTAAKRIDGLQPWQFRSAATQLSNLARLLDFDGSGSAADFAASEAGRVLAEFLGEARAGLESAYVGKVGLALSGGGFRASLYHIGVLARLAELDALRHIEVISCVSGGSIIGAHYYLELRKLLADRKDAELSADDYVALVERVEKGFLAGVQRNLRIRIAAEWLTNLRMIFAPNYSRTQRLGELYETEIYSEVKDGGEDKPRYISDLYVVPKDNEQEGSFDPRQQNWTRAHKVPILILNATTLNTGHNWQFTASWMGEPPTTVNPKIDSNYRLRRMYYGEAPPEHRQVRLGTAVGASSCVPGLFEPIVLDDLYRHPDDGDGSQRISVRLVDGGVHDNQGVVGLIEQDCDVMLVSDASGQMGSEDVPSRGLIGVPLRSNGILQARVRDAEYTDLCARERSRELRELMFIHLTMDLPTRPVDWVGAVGETRPPAEPPQTPYGIEQKVQALLAANRTDLDAWCDAEAYALMLSGYRMAEYEFPKTIRSLPPPRPLKKSPRWRFLAVDPLQQAADERSTFMRVLAVGRDRALKVWRLNPVLRAAGVVLLALAAVALGWLAWTWRGMALVTVGSIAIAVLTLAGAAVFGKLVMRIVRVRETLTKIGLGIAMATVGFLVARLHLHVFNPLYLKLGRIAADDAPDEGNAA